MQKIRYKTHAALNLPSLRLEGALFLPDQLEKAALGDAIRQTEADYLTPKGLRLKDDYSRAFQIACAQWRYFAQITERSDSDPAAASHTFVLELLRDAFGYHSIQAIAGLSANERHYPISLLAGAVPVVVAPHTLGLDSADERFAISHSTGGGSRKKTAFQLAQEWLNTSPEHLWALVTNGKQLRLLRDAETLTRPSYLEIDLQDLLSGQRFAEFAMAWRLLHASRAGHAGKETVELAENCIWEAWREVGKEEGTRVRDGLRQGVTQALLTLGSGFLRHPANDQLRQQLQDGQLSKDGYFQQLLRLIYRLIFLFTVEERGVLHPVDDSQEAQQARRAYAEGYAMARLRDRALKRRARNRFDDVWQAACVVFHGLHQGETRLALPALGGLFAQGQCPALDNASLCNADLLQAILHLRWDNASGSLAPVDYRNMGPEELGSVYESLLELVPEVDLPARQFSFAGLTSEGSTQGNARKTSGSYYTPDSLVQQLIRSALEPVIEQRLAANPANPTAALLDIKVIDPACGSGHFLLAAARRLAEHLAAMRSSEGAVKPQEYRHALREVISHCIFGVDRNPMALELCRTALWLEGFEEGRPLSFLDHHLQCGDALLGLTDLNALQSGIPGAAFKPLSGDDKNVCKELNKANKAGLKQMERDLKSRQQVIRFDQASGLDQLQALEALPEDTPADVAVRAAAYADFAQQAASSRIAQAADLLLGAFVLPKTEETAAQVPTSETLYLHLFSDHHNTQHQQQLQAAGSACRAARVLHWPLAFPQVFAQGGFDCVLGNPPWEVSQLGEEEYFSSRAAWVAKLKGQARKNAVEELRYSAPDVWVKYLEDKRVYELFNSYARSAKRFDLTGRGKLNTYSLFSETMLNLICKGGLAGFIVPSGIATDDSNKLFFSRIVSSKMLVSFFGFDNAKKIFPSVHSDTPFALVTLGDSSGHISMAHYLLNVADLSDPRRVFGIEESSFSLFNPNTKTCPIFRSERDFEVAKKLYASFAVLLSGECEENNPWNLTVIQNFFSSSGEDKKLFFPVADGLDKDAVRPVLRGAMIDQFNHRSASYSLEAGRFYQVDNSVDACFLPAADRYVPVNILQDRIAARGWNKEWMLCWRDITNATNWRTLIAAVIPLSATDDTLSLLLPEVSAELAACLLANLNSIVLDYIVQMKVGGTHVRKYIISQIPVIPPHEYLENDFTFVVPRVLELTYTAWDLQPWALDLGYTGEPFAFDESRRAQLRAELDAWYARAYGLTRDQLRYILDPADIEGPDYPSETFRVLQKNELKNHGEYRTRRLVLEAWDKLEAGELAPSQAPCRKAPHQSDGTDGTALDNLLWQRIGTDLRADTGVQLIALLKAANTPLPIRQIRLAAALAMEPRLMVPMLGERKAAEWQRLIGDEAKPLPTNVLTFASRSNQEWGAAVRNLRTNGYLVENQKNLTWEPGPSAHKFTTPAWADGRANWVLDIIQSVNTEELLTQLPEAAREWINDAA